jgi:homoserine kinase
MEQITVRVPASTSNLGPGFDCLGVALRIHNTVTVARGVSRQHLHPPIVSEAADRFFNQARRRAFSFSCLIAEQIPRSRGLGSSATIRLGILLALNRFSGNPLDRLKIFQSCAELEGHPDNAAPATFGGFTVVAGSAHCADRTPQRDVPTIQRFAVSPRLYFVLLVPDLSHADAVENCANACALAAAFVSQDYKKLRGVFGDHLHQPFRTKLVPFLPGVVAAAEQAGALGAFLSGSGSTIAAVTLRSANKVGQAMLRATGAIPARIIITRKFSPVTNPFLPITILHGASA